jgi:hypothetical protein
LSKANLTVEVKSIQWSQLRSLNVPVVNEAIDICHDKGMAQIMAMNFYWTEEVVAQFYANLYIKRETKTMYWTIQGKPLSVTYERFDHILGFGSDDLGCEKIHGGEISLDSEMAFMYDSAYDNIEFGTTHGMKPIYRMLNQFFRYTMSSKICDIYNISNIANYLLVRMALGQEPFSVFDFIWEEIIVCSMATNKSCQYAPWIFKMICEVTGVNICSDKVHTYYKPNKGNIERLLKLGKHAPPRPTSLAGSSSAGSSTFDSPSFSQGPSHAKGHPLRR